ncbi:MAG: CBS domain-containing protein [Clostridium sp.]|nr:MAG: CBS domain-containing protein [Clostridium sp.]
MCTKKREMVYAEINDSLKSIVNLMIQNGYSHIPVLDKTGVLIGVFSSNVFIVICL